MRTVLRWIERGRVPTGLVRLGIRRLLRQRLRDESRRFDRDRAAALKGWIETMRKSPIAMHTDAANEQHYEVPPAFFLASLGKRLKYSSCYYPEGTESLDEAEEHMLRLTCERAGLQNGQRVLELGCGWGSLTLWMAEQYPKSAITAVSNSAPQRLFIEGRAKERGLTNLRVITCDMNELEASRLGVDSADSPRFERVVSVEMFEHMRNWERLLTKVASWITPEARVFIHVFAHDRYAYPFEVVDDSDWMSRYFFTGGMMPSDDLMRSLEAPLEVDQSWKVNGRHYSRTAEHWLENLDARRSEVLPVLAETYGTDEAETWFQRWRVFFLACAELFGYQGGEEWFVSHYLLRPVPPSRTA